MGQYIKTFFWITNLQRKTSPLYFVWGIANSIINGLTPILQTFALAKLIAAVSNVALKNEDPNGVYFWLGFLLLFEVLSRLITTIDRVAVSRFQQKIELASNEQFFKKMYELSQEQFDNQEFNTKLDRAKDGLRQIWRVSDEIQWVASALIGFFGSITTLIVVEPIIGLVIIASIIPAAIVQVKQNKIREEMYKEIEPIERVSYRSRWMLLDTSFMLEVRIMNAFNALLESWKSNLKKSQSHTYKIDVRMAKMDILVGAIQPLVGFGANIFYFSILLDGGIGLDRFIFLRGMLEQANSGASRVAYSVQRLHSLFISLKNFNEIFNAKSTVPNGNIEIERPLSIEFKNVSFTYPGSDLEVLNDVSFSIFPGSKLAIVGENGAGKTTLIKLLLRQYLPTKGEIIVNGVNIKDIKQESYYSAVSNLSQEFLMAQHLSIKENLVMGLADKTTDKKIYEATSLVDMTDYIKQLPKALDSRLDPSFNEGTSLSGGQKQRLGVARAILRNGDLMILDEPTSAIDAKAEYTIFNNIYRAHASKTTLIVSHRFSTVRKADKIIVMEKGKITEYGSHEELIKYNGLYKEMFEVQAEGYK